MNKFYTIIAALVLCVCTSMVRAQEPVKIEVSAPAAQAFAEAEAKRVERMQAAAERAGMGFWETRRADAGKVWGATKWAACKVGQGASNADGYVGMVIAVPTGYVAGTAFNAAASCADAAASIK